MVEVTKRFMQLALIAAVLALGLVVSVPIGARATAQEDRGLEVELNTDLGTQGFSPLRPRVDEDVEVDINIEIEDEPTSTPVGPDISGPVGWKTVAPPTDRLFESSGARLDLADGRITPEEAGATATENRNRILDERRQDINNPPFSRRVESARRRDRCRDLDENARLIWESNHPCERSFQPPLGITREDWDPTSPRPDGSVPGDYSILPRSQTDAPTTQLGAQFPAFANPAVIRSAPDTNTPEEEVRDEVYEAKKNLVAALRENPPYKEELGLVSVDGCEWIDKEILRVITEHEALDQCDPSSSIDTSLVDDLEGRVATLEKTAAGHTTQIGALERTSNAAMATANKALELANRKTHGLPMWAWLLTLLIAPCGWFAVRHELKIKAIRLKISNMELKPLLPQEPTEDQPEPWADEPPLSC